jgi:hypothetical protein
VKAPFTLPDSGAGILLPMGISGVAVPGGAGVGPIAFRWPFRTWLYALRVVELTANTPQSLADLSLEIVDGDGQRVTTDGQGFALATNLLGLNGPPQFFSLPGGGGFGRAHALQRLVQPGETWHITLRNANGVAARKAELAFYLGTPRRG